MGERMINI